MNTRYYTVNRRNQENKITIALEQLPKNKVQNV